MAKYNVVHSCGHETTYQLFGKQADRMRKLDWMADNLCPDCYRKQKEEERASANAKAAAENAESGLPELQGTEKQVAWAETIRNEQIAIMAKVETRLLKAKEMINTAGDGDTSVSKRRQVNIDSEQKKKALAKIEALGYHSAGEYLEALFAVISELYQETSASWWIENRYNGVFEWMTIIEKHGLEWQKARIDKAPGAEEACAEAMLIPVEAATNTPAEISVSGEIITVKFPVKNREFWEIIKPGLGFSWTGKHWEKDITVYDGDIVDRAAETGHKLLAGGFPVIIWDDTIKEKAVSGEYDPAHTRWITRSTKTGNFNIRWFSGDYYREARLISGSQWSSPYVTVPPAEYKELLDFADEFDFKLSPGALEGIKEQKDLLEKATVVKVAPVVVEDAPGKERPVLDPEQVDGAIDDDLHDN